MNFLWKKEFKAVDTNKFSNKFMRSVLFRVLILILGLLSWIILLSGLVISVKDAYLQPHNNMVLIIFISKAMQMALLPFVVGYFYARSRWLVKYYNIVSHYTSGNASFAQGTAMKTREIKKVSTVDLGGNEDE
ncbi:hypothetical protein HCJ46_17115 [Listeria booriae]|uniref:hypothetical protein n=1 Tax=Listeria booriae TaxID=1552123 RepID=UPI0016256891|nr:hypothetical protein [Listeria booriae]MBC1920474.1 hypothetical protein [Listeria booriae]